MKSREVTFLHSFGKIGRKEREKRKNKVREGGKNKKGKGERRKK